MTHHNHRNNMPQTQLSFFSEEQQIAFVVSPQHSCDFTRWWALSQHWHREREREASMRPWRPHAAIDLQKYLRKELGAGVIPDWNGLISNTLPGRLIGLTQWEQRLRKRVRNRFISGVFEDIVMWMLHQYSTKLQGIAILLFSDVHLLEMHLLSKSIEENMIRVWERQKKVPSYSSTHVIWSDFDHSPEEDNELTMAKSGSELVDKLFSPGKKNKGFAKCRVA